MPGGRCTDGTVWATTRVQDHSLLQILKEAARSGLSRLPHSFDCSRVVVLCYHSVHPRGGRSSVPPELFDEHMQWLAANTKIVRFSDVVAVRSQLGRARPTVAVTFDDGYDDNHRFALPVLVRHKIPATFFVTTGFADGDPEVVERFRKMLGVGPGETRGMGWTEIDELRAEGMDIGSHTITHPNLACLSDRDACNEIEGSKHRLEDYIASEIRSIAYPFGLPRRSFSRKTIEIAVRAGYKWGGAILFRDLRKQDGAWSIPRIAAANEPVESLQRKVVGGYDWLGFYQEHAPMWALTALSTNSVLASLADRM